MDFYQLKISSQAEKTLRKLPPDITKRLSKAIDKLSKDPFPSGSLKLVGSEADYRIRVGDYRIIYQIRESALIVFVIRIGHRKDIYR